MALDDALVDVGIAFLQVEFSIKLLSYCELDRIRPAEFDTHQVVLLEQENLAFPTGRFSTQEDIVRAAMVAVSLALAGSALTLDKAWDIAGFRPDPRCCFALYPVGSPRDLTGMFRRRISWDDGTVREALAGGEVAFLMNDCCRGGEDVDARAPSVGKGWSSAAHLSTPCPHGR